MENKRFQQLYEGYYFIHYCEGDKYRPYFKIEARYKKEFYYNFTKEIKTVFITLLNSNNFKGEGVAPKAEELIGAQIYVSVNHLGRFEWEVLSKDDDFNRQYFDSVIPCEGIDFTDLNDIPEID